MQCILIHFGLQITINYNIQVIYYTHIYTYVNTFSHYQLRLWYYQIAPQLHIDVDHHFQ